MNSKKVSGAEFVRSVFNTVGIGQLLVGTFISTVDGLNKLDEQEYWQRLESMPMVFDGDNDTQDVDGDALFGFVTFDASARIEILEANNCLGITDCGSHEVVVNFEKRLEPYIYSFFASEPLQIVKATETRSSLRLIFNRAYSGVIKIVFFQKVLGVEVN